MKVKVTHKNRPSASVGSLDVGDGFVFEGQPYVVADSALGLRYNGFVLVFNLRASTLTTMPRTGQVQLYQIDVEYTI